MKYITASHLAFDVWKNSMKKEKYLIYLTKDTNVYNFIRKSIYGGRTYPLQKEYTSQHYHEVKLIQESELPQDVKEKYISEIYEQAVTKTFDFIYNGDINSLYPDAGQVRKSNR